MEVLLVAISVQLLAGCAAAAFSKWPRTASAIGAGGAAVGCLLALALTTRVLLGGPTESVRWDWDASHGAFCVQIDALSAFFLLPVLTLSALAAVYGGNYLLAFRREKSLGGPWFFFNWFVAGMTLVVVARTALLFLVAWEIMSIAAFCLVIFEHQKSEVRRAGWIYLIATHIGVAFLLLGFVLLGRNAGSFEFDTIRTFSGRGPVLSGIIFVLGLIGFGTKAGFVPFHVWLPEAHPAAPSHVSALMSGVMIKTGLYGILRFVILLGPPAPWWGVTLAGIGLMTAVVGIALATYQRDIKRVLAYSSIENMGLIAIAFGVGLWGWASDLPAVAVLGMTAGLLHIWNHALMKGLMFLAAGSVLHATGERDMEKLGGLLKKMPWTGSAMIVGAVAIAALPPLNGFVSKWLIYLNLMNISLASKDGQSLVALLAVGLVALVGGLALVTFVRLTGIVLLGLPRSDAARHAHESSAWLVGPMLALVVLCLGMAVFPGAAIAGLSRPISEILGPAVRQSSPNIELWTRSLAFVGQINAGTLIAIGAVGFAVLVIARTAIRSQGATWGCGYLQPTVRMQYTGRSFAEMIAEHVLPRFLRPHTRRRAPRGLFPVESDFASVCRDPFSEKIYFPFFRRWTERFSRLRILQQGVVHLYLIYIALTVVAALAWVSLRSWWSAL